MPFLTFKKRPKTYLFSLPFLSTNQNIDCKASLRQRMPPTTL